MRCWSFRSIPTLKPGLLLLVAALASAPIARAQDFSKDVKPFLTAYCIECHKPGKAKGDLDLTKFTDKASIAALQTGWTAAVDRTQASEMPPKKAKQPSANERKDFVKAARAMVKGDLDCSQISTDGNTPNYRGHVMSRRLNRLEYDNTVRDLLGLDTRSGTDLPADGAGGEGFDNNGDSLFTSALHVEKYVDAAGTALAYVLGDRQADKRFTPEQVAAARKRVLVATPDAKTPPRDAAKKVVAEFARRAFRRPVEPAEVERYLKLFDKAAARGDAFDPAVKLALQGVLVSPNFLFLVEPEPADDGVHPLADYPLASRLSYFLWASMPDEELFALAAKGKLQDTEVLRQQVKRMLADPKAKGMAESFATQWLGLRSLNETAKPDAARFPAFNDALADAMRQEAVLLFDHVVRADRPLTDLIAADYTFLNEPLARHYGVPGVTGDQMRLVKLSDPTRGGVLGLGAVHVTTSYPLRTSPVLRGKWVLGDVLGARVPPPPPNAGELPEDDKHAGGLSLRKQLELHRVKPECASCHDRMDPLGFGLENYDAIGRWRTSDAGGQPIDSTGVLPGGERFEGPAGLRKVLLNRKAEFQTNLSRKLLGFALGREIRAGGRRPGQFDQCVVDDCTAALAKSEGRSQAVFEAIVLSKPFRTRFTKK
ncbi:MAG TPA: DUF1592 domain-containing protein [Humisphaera sp.]